MDFNVGWISLNGGLQLIYLDNLKSQIFIKSVGVIKIFVRLKFLWKKPCLCM